MKVFQAPLEIAGQMGLLTKGLRALGHDVSSYNTWNNYLAYHKNIHNVNAPRLQSIFKRHKRDFDVFHFHYGLNFMSKFEDFRYARNHGKVAIMQYWGSDVRTEKKATEHNPYATLIGEFGDARSIKRQIRRHSHYLSACIVQDFEVVPYVAEYFDRVYVLPIAIDLDGIDPVYSSNQNADPVILHAPTQPFFKGTVYIEEALNRLRQDGYQFQYTKIHGLAHDEAIKHYATSDIVIDQVLCGSHGLFAVEAMGYGKPVISYIREDLIHRFPDSLSVVSANPATLYEAVRGLLTQPQTWLGLGRLGRQYVETYHSLPTVAKGLDWIYRREKLLRKLRNREQFTPCVIQWLGGEKRCFKIHPKTRLVDIAESPIPMPQS